MSVSVCSSNGVAPMSEHFVAMLSFVIDSEEISKQISSNLTKPFPQSASRGLSTNYIPSENIFLLLGIEKLTPRTAICFDPIDHEIARNRNSMIF